MQNKNILIITPFFAPETHAAVFRAHKLVKYLKREGWNPIVLTVDVNYNYNEDGSLLEDLKDVEIHRTKYIEPSLRGLYMWLTGKDRTFKTLKKQAVFSKSEENNISTNFEAKNSFKQTFYNYLLENWLNSPDRFWTWEKGAIKKGDQLIKKYNIKYIYTSSLPFTTFKIGSALKRKHNIKWITDFRDPIMYSKRTHSSILRVFNKQKKIEINALENANVIIGLSSAYKLIYHDLYGGKYDDKMFFIPTGIDDDYIPKEQIELSNEILYVGEFLKDYGKLFFKFLEKVIEENPNLKSNFQLRFIGNILINKKAIQEIGLSKQIQEILIFEDHLTQIELYKRIKAAKAVLLIPGLHSHWWTNFAKMVDYIGLQKNVLAIVPNPSEARKELTFANLGMFMDTEEEAIKIIKLVLSGHTLQPNEVYCKKYLASTQTNAFIEIFESL